LLQTPPPLTAAKRDPKSATGFLRGPEVTPEIETASEDATAAEATEPRDSTQPQSALADTVAGLWWYHTIEMPGGVVSRGMFDHRPLVPYYGIPERLQNRRCLDIACSNGFWAFEFERRGGDVTAVDVGSPADWDWPTWCGQERPTRDNVGDDSETVDAFEVARDALGSRVQRVIRNLYELDPQELGTFDFVHAGDVLVHLERPLEALRCFRRMLADGGTALFADAVDLNISDPTLARWHGGVDLIWFLPSLDCFAQMVYDAGFSSVEAVSIYNVPPRSLSPGMWHAALRARP
jgi:tRNA (mo5U34)-methyltransferase